MTTSGGQLAAPPLLSSASAALPRPEAGDNKRRILYLLLAVAAVGGTALAAKYSLQRELAWPCPVMQLWHLPCPSCGSTRALAALSELRWLDAFRFNPLLVTAIPVAIFCSLRRQRFFGDGRWLWPFVTVAVALNWVYLLLFLPR